MITGFGAPRIIGQPSELLGRGQSLGKAPALWLRRAKPAFAYAIVETLGGFPNPPALWLRRAKPAFAYAIMGTLKGSPNPRWYAASDEGARSAGRAGWAVRPEVPEGGARWLPTRLDLFLRLW